MELEFVTADTTSKCVGDFLRHMEDLQNIAFKKGETLKEIIDKLRTMNVGELKTTAIEEWIQLNDDSMEATVENIVGFDNGFLVFNFKSENKPNE